MGRNRAYRDGCGENYALCLWIFCCTVFTPQHEQRTKVCHCGDAYVMYMGTSLYSYLSVLFMYIVKLACNYPFWVPFLMVNDAHTSTKSHCHLFKRLRIFNRNDTVLPLTHFKASDRRMFVAVLEG